MVAGAAAVFPMPAADAAIFVPSPEGRMETLFHQWRELFTAFELEGKDSDESHFYPLLHETELAIFDIEPSTLREFAIKVLVGLNYDTDNGCHGSCDLACDAENIVGLPKPYGYQDYKRDRAAGGTA
jgi:hypothetical protein